MISLHIVGNIGQDAIVKEVGNKKVIEFSVAHSEKYKDKEGNAMTRTTWVKCSKWGETTGVATYLTKGSKVYVEGVPTSEAWLKDGAAQSSIKLLVNKIELLGGSQAAGEQSTGAVATEPEEKLPF